MLIRPGLMGLDGLIDVCEPRRTNSWNRPSSCPRYAPTSVQERPPSWNSDDEREAHSVALTRTSERTCRCSKQGENVLLRPEKRGVTGSTPVPTNRKVPGQISFPPTVCFGLEIWCLHVPSGNAQAGFTQPESAGDT
jgi:hypothetical protein